jgi:hypothetical protein
MTTTETKKIEIKMSERRPLKINPEEWPTIAKAGRHDGKVACQANTVWYIRVRAHADGRRIVYGAKMAGAGGQYAGFREVRAGYLVDTDEGTVRAIRRVGGVIDDDQIACKCIADLPAEEV